PKVSDPAFRAITFKDLVEAYREQVNGLLDGGADILMVETIFDTLNAKAALFAIMEIFEERNLEFLLPNDLSEYSKKKIPLMVSGTITDASGRTLSGQTAEAFIISMSHAPLFSIGFNCALGATQLVQYVEVLSDNVNCAVSVYPNAGLPNEMGHYDQSPEQMGKLMKEYCDRGIVNIVGGCCGTTPEHIRSISTAVREYSPRKIAADLVV
ncbi:MAG: homocysteine S-methyltransferase family protein, partial [Nitrospirota bacterium]|nr:homocysteine S-methyltransferase family protein [Nitrospirota bacterium]